ncbi:competence protein CoiA [Ferdinandcohnia sp. Marseille-Q9671]
MFVALRENGEYISLVEKWNRSDLLDIRARESFQCPACRTSVQLKAGLKKTSHFAHVKGAVCTVSTEPESEYHLQGKRQLYEWLQAQGYDVRLEPYLSEVAQRPDLFLTTQNHRYAIEYQCSVIDYSQFKKRSDSYKKLGILPIWIIGAKWFKRLSTNSIKLSPFQWLFATSFNQISHPSILYYCPESSQFLKVSNLFPFTSSETFGSIQLYKKKNISFMKLLTHTTHFSVESDWLRRKKNWRIRYSNYSTKHIESFLNALYQTHIPPAHLPAEAGLPLPTSYWFHTPPMIWQMWILLEILLPLRVGKTFFFSTVMEAISKRIVSSEISLRQLPLVSLSQYSLAVSEYLHLLVTIGILKRVSNTTYQKVNDIHIPTNLQEAYDMDEALFKGIKDIW